MVNKFKKLSFWCFSVVVVLFSSCGSSKHSAQSHENKEVDKLVQYAESFVGAPYKAGGDTPSGFDCSGFTQYVFKKFKHRLPRSTAEQSRTGSQIDKNDVKVGDLVFFKGKNQRSQDIGHVGIVVKVIGKKHFRFIHASTTKGIVTSGSLEDYYRVRYLSARRIVR